jgi:Mce-associated membrane protein
MTAAARAAAKRSERRGQAELDEGGTPRGEGRSGPTVVMEAPGGWDDPPEPSPEPSSEPAGEESTKTVPTRWRGRRALTVALGVALVAALAVACVLGWRYREGRQADQARAQALAAAQQAAPVVLSYDYRHLDRDFARARAWLTGGFRDQYLKTTGTVVGPTATKYHGVVSATVAAPSGGSPAASGVSATPAKAVVLLFVNQVTQSTQVTGSRLDLNRVRMTMTRTSSGWKVSAVDAL